MTIADKEHSFVEQIDCNFPYTNQTRAHALIDEAANISSTALFATIYELAYPPNDTLATAHSERLSLLEYAADKLSHPLKDLIIDIAKRNIVDDALTANEVIEAMQTISQHRGEYLALNIAYFSNVDSNDKGMDEIDEMSDAIEAIWQADH